VAGTDKPLSEMSDAELEAERERRRRVRAARGPTPEPPAGGRVARALESLAKERDVAQAYANLELKPGASLADVEKKFAELSARYAPEKHKSNPDRFKAATELLTQLRKAHALLVVQLSKTD
jgi:hypothetical protein